MANILILGGGFGGLVAAEELSASLGKEHRITLVSPGPKFTFYPALVRLAFNDCQPDDITFDLVEKLDELNVRFVRGEAVGIKANQRLVRVAGEDFDGEVSYDFLVIALGRRLANEKVKGFFEYAHHLLDTKAALRFGEEIRTFKEGDIVVGMSPHSFLPVPVCETAFALAKRFEREIAGEKISVSVVFPESIEKAFAGAEIHRELVKAFHHHDIFVTTQFPVGEITEREVISQKGLPIEYDLLMLLPPFRGHSFLNNTGITGEFDFLIADERMRVPHFPGVYAAGDIVDFSGPKLAQMAVLQAKVAAANIVSEIKGKEPNEFYYHEIATIIDSGGADSIYLNYGIWDEHLHRLKKGKLWSWIKRVHDKMWRAAHET